LRRRLLPLRLVPDFSGPSIPLSNRLVRSLIAFEVLRHREGGPLESGRQGDSPGAAGKTRPPVTPRKGGRTQQPLPQGPIGGPGGRDPGSPLWGAKNN
jgi:hypothetical protein